MDVRLVFAKNDKEGNSVTLSKAEAGMEGLAKAIVVEKPVDRSKTHPYRTGDAVQEINKRIREQYSDDYLREYLRCSSAPNGKTEINDFDFRSIAHKLGWKNGNNAEHYKNENPETHYYSDKAIEESISKILGNEGYLDNARKSYSNRSKSSGS